MGYLLKNQAKKKALNSTPTAADSKHQLLNIPTAAMPTP